MGEKNRPGINRFHRTTPGLSWTDLARRRLAVRNALAGVPRRRSVRAELPHAASASGDGGDWTEPDSRTPSNEAPRPEAEVSGSRPRGGRSRQEAPVGGGESSRAGSKRFGRGPAAFPALLQLSRSEASRSAPKGDCPSGLGLRPRGEAQSRTGSLEALRVTRPEAVAS
jgi:hypothetical protein